MSTDSLPHWPQRVGGPIDATPFDMTLGEYRKADLGRTDFIVLSSSVNKLRTSGAVGTGSISKVGARTKAVLACFVRLQMAPSASDQFLLTFHSIVKFTTSLFARSRPAWRLGIF